MYILRNLIQINCVLLKLPDCVHNLGFFPFSSQNSLGAVSNAEAQRRPNFKSTTDGGTHTDNSLATVDLKSFKDNLMKIIQANKERWKELAVEGKIY